MRKLVRVYEIGDQVPSDQFTHQPDYQPQPGELVAVRDHETEDWFIRVFAGFLRTGEGTRKVLAYSTAGNEVCVKWNQISFLQGSPKTKPEPTFDSVVKTLLEANVVLAVEYKAKGDERALRFDATETDLQEALDIVKMDQIREQALAKLSEVERKALGL